MATGKKKTRKKVPSSDGKERIILAAVELFRTSGPMGVRLKEIAKIARVDPPLIHYYFKSIDDLQFEVILRILAELREASISPFLQASSLVERMRGYVSSYFKWADSKRDLLKIWIYFYALAVEDPRYRKLNSQIRKEGRDRIKMMIYEGIEKGEFRPPLGQSVDGLALHIQGIITGNVIMALSEENLLTFEEFESQTLRFVLEILGAKAEGAKT